MASQNADAFVGKLREFHDSLPSAQQRILRVVLDHAQASTIPEPVSTDEHDDTAGYGMQVRSEEEWEALINWIGWRCKGC